MEKVLNLTLNRKWYDLILKGEKKLEYRELKKYWISRFSDVGSKANSEMTDLIEFVPKKFDMIIFRNGYAKNAPSFKIECLGITLQRGVPCPLGEGDYFVIELGEIQ